MMLARRRTTILPAMTLAEALDATRTPRVAGLTGASTAFDPALPGAASHHLGCGADRRGAGAAAGKGVAGPPRRALPG
jgi:hypothetical protein